MERFRIGFDMTVLWSVSERNGVALPLGDKEVHLYYTCERGRYEADIEITDGNVVVWHFLSKDQRALGTYALTLEVIQSNGKRAIRKDICEAFALVGKSCFEHTEEGDAEISEGGEITLASELDIYRISPIIPQIGSNGNWFVDGKDTGKPSLSYDRVAIDSELSLVSTNAVQNKAVTQAIDRLNVYITGFSVNEIIEHLANRTEFAMQQGEGNDICNAIIAGKTILVPYDHDSATSGFAVFVGSIVDENVIIRLITTGDICTAYIGVDDFRNDVLLAYDSYVSNALDYNADSNPTPNTIPVRDEYGALYMTAIIDDNSMVWTTPTSSDDSHCNADHIIQEQLVSGTNIKTINGESILGEGNLTIQGSNDSYDDTEIRNELSEKADKTYVDNAIAQAITTTINANY